MKSTTIKNARTGGEDIGHAVQTGVVTAVSTVWDTLRFLGNGVVGVGTGLVTAKKAKPVKTVTKPKRKSTTVARRV